MRYLFGTCRVDTGRRELVRDQQVVHLSPKAFELLCVLIQARPNVLTKAALMTAIWPDTFVVEANLPVLVAEVRGALGDTASNGAIKTHHGIGYSFVPDVRELRGAADPLSAGDPRAVLRIGDRSVLLGHGANVVGRDLEAEVFISDPSISRRHARIVVENGAFRIEDLGSKNGTSVNGDRLTAPAPLADGDLVEFGSVKGRFCLARRDDPSTLTL
ncbi:MAG: FHA domain-containing protein [Vicinamibacterales bacterium]